LALSAFLPLLAPVTTHANVTNSSKSGTVSCSIISFLIPVEVRGSVGTALQGK
jgi:hypothetical protein